MVDVLKETLRYGSCYDNHLSMWPLPLPSLPDEVESYGSAVKRKELLFELLSVPKNDSLLQQPLSQLPFPVVLVWVHTHTHTHTHTNMYIDTYIQYIVHTHV